jgi:hypothetical protein
VDLKRLKFEADQEFLPGRNTLLMRGLITRNYSTSRMRRSLSYFQSCYVRYNGGMPQFLDMRGKRNLDILKMMKAELSPEFDKFTVDELELWKPDGQKVAKISDLILSDHETEENALILRLKPKKIKIKDELGFITEHEVTSQDHLESILIKQGSKGLMSNFKGLSDGKIYRSLIPKNISVISVGSNSEVENTVPLYSEKDLQDYLGTHDLEYLFESRKLRPIVSFEAIRPEKTHTGHPRVPTFNCRYILPITPIEFEACSAAEVEIEKILRDQNVEETLFDVSEEFQKDRRLLNDWEEILYAPGNDTLYLIECKHTMRPNLLRQIINSRDAFIKKLPKLGLADEEGFKSSNPNVVGIVCARNFPETLRVQAKLAGLLTLSPFIENIHMKNTSWSLHNPGSP